MMTAIFVVFALRGATAAATPPLEPIAANDNRVEAGTPVGGGVSISMTARRGLWYPDGPNTTGVPYDAFGEDGKPLQMPGPLVRVRAGTPVTLHVRSALVDRTIAVHGLTDDGRAIVLAPGSVSTVVFRRTKPGTYGYWTSDVRETYRSALQLDGGLVGAIVIDDAKKPRPLDRVFVIADWDNVWRKDGTPRYAYELLTVNGRAWPATEHLAYRRGDVVRWRVVNGSYGTHPMHLHGFPFVLDAVGDGTHVLSAPANAKESEVTQRIATHETADLHFTAARVGSWMFHCHFAFHVLAHPPLAGMIVGVPDPTLTSMETLYHKPQDTMGGLILAVSVKPAPGDRPLARPRARHQLALSVDQSPDTDPKATVSTTYAYHLTDRGTSVAPSGQLGPLIVLAAGEPTAIAVTNHLTEPTAVHWHGIEVQHSEDDGSMMTMNDTMAGSMGASAIAPGSTFVAQFTPPRAGTFMYHTHYDGVWQLVGGLAGPLVVLPRGQTYDPATDHIVMLTDDAANIGTKSRVNGERTPRLLVMHRSVAQRLRLINMTSTNPDLSIAIEGDPQATWLPIAADGVDFPAALRVPVKPIRRLTIGETRDFLFAPTTVGPLKINVYENGLLLASQTVIVQP